MNQDDSREGAPQVLDELEFTEPERYELHEGLFYHFELTRREFVATLGAGLVLSVAIPSALAQRAPRGGERSAPLAQRLHIGADGRITVFTSKVEVGQGSRTQLTQAAAEELHVPVERVLFVMGDTAGPDDGGTAGSRTTPASVPTIRKACAAARQLLLETAATAFSASAEKLSVQGGAVVGLPAGKKFGYVDLAAGTYADVLKRDATPGVTLAEVSKWRVLGQPVPKTSGREIVTGTHRYPSDIVRPGMLYGRILRSPSPGASLTDLDLGPAKALPGVSAVRDGDFVGVAARNSFEAAQALEAIEKTARWKSGNNLGSDVLFGHLRSTASTRSRPDRKGTPEEHFKNEERTRRAQYQVAYIQHAPMEPRTAVAEWKGDDLTVWTGSQQPARVRQDLAQALRVPIERVHVIVPDTGGGFGGKHSGEVAVEAARLAREAGNPVRIRWTREEEFTWAYFRPAGVIDVAATLDEQSHIAAWEQINFNSGASALGTPYAIANTSTEFRSCDQPLRSGSYRGLAATANTFARESFMDELAVSVAVDPLEFRLKHLSNDRLKAVLTTAAERFGWKRAWTPAKTRSKTGVGLACGTEKGSYVACCAEVAIDESAGTYRVVRVVEAFECGAVQNPANLRAQVDGCIIMGLGGALSEEVRYQEGRVTTASFSKYRVPRLRHVPEIESILVNRPDLPSIGAGETPIIGIAPAVANAVFHATQQRLRSMPIRNEQIRSVTLT